MTPDLEEEFTLAVTDAPPVAGAALLGLDRIGTALPAEAVAGAFRGTRPSALPLTLAGDG